MYLCLNTTADTFRIVFSISSGVFFMLLKVKIIWAVQMQDVALGPSLPKTRP